MTERSSTDPGIVGAGVILIVLGAPILLLGLLMVPTGYFIGISEPEFAGLPNRELLGLMIGIGEGILFGGWGVLLAATGVGLAMHRLWAWRLAVPILVLMTLTLCCAPIAGPGLYLLLRDSARHSLGMR